MFKKAKVFYIHTVSPMHVGSGSDLGIVDMPIQREGHTGFPKIEASSLKGSIREAFEQKTKNDVNSLIKTYITFGYDDTNAPSAVESAFKEKKDKEYAGSLGFSDGRILLFPVKSAKGIFAWITCPQVLNRYFKDLKISGRDENFEIIKNSVPDKTSIMIDENNIILEEYQISVVKNNNTTKIAEFLSNELGVDKIKEKLVILNDDDFKDFVTLSTEVITRTKIDNSKGTVKDGALFTEEYLPSETIMYSLVMSSSIIAKVDVIKDLNSEDDVLSFFTTNVPSVMQVGGNATIGKGIVSIKVGG